MKGFIRCNGVSRNLSQHDWNYFITTHDDFDKYNNWNMLRKAGISPYPEFNIYVSDIYGAWMGNINGNVSNLNELVSLSHIDLDTYTTTPFSEFIEAGYELIIGPAVPEINGKIYGKGVYCTNWKELIDNKELIKIKK